jgi:competence protein ComEC
LGINRVDGLILTHYDEDHAGGVEGFLTRIQADMLYLPATDGECEIAQRLQTRNNTHLVDENLKLEYGSSKLTIFTANGMDSGNESSLCILFQAGNCDILITGDRNMEGEQFLMEMVELPQLEVLVAGHHGSKYSTSAELLAATNPQVVVISVGENNPHGHPTQEVLDRLRDLGCIVFRTDEDGTITIRR